MKILRSLWLSFAGYLVAAFGIVQFAYGSVPPFTSYASSVGLGWVHNPLGWASLTLAGVTVASASAVLDATRRARWAAHRIDYFFALVGALVIVSFTTSLLDWTATSPPTHFVSWGSLFVLAGYCWETTAVRLSARTLVSTLCWRRVFQTLPMRQFAGAVILIVVVLSTATLLTGARTAVAVAASRTMYNPVGVTAWFVSVWMPNVLAPAAVLAVVAILGLNIVSVTAAQQRAIQAQLREERFRAELITNVTHDLRTPLTSIISYADLINRYPTADPTLSEYTAVLGRKAERLRVLIGDVLDVSRVSAGSVTVNLEPLELTEILGQVAGDFDAALARRQLTWAITPSDPLVVSADGAVLWRILENLVGNVVAHARPGTEVVAEVLPVLGGAAIRLRNQLNAPLAVPPETLTQQFVRGDPARHGEGSGLGLFIADRLAAAMGAVLSIEATNSEFIATVSLPLTDRAVLSRSSAQAAAVQHAGV